MILDLREYGSVSKVRVRSASGPERLCPRCKGGEFRRGFSSVTGYWAGQVIVPVICLSLLL